MLVAKLRSLSIPPMVRRRQLEEQWKSFKLQREEDLIPFDSPLDDLLVDMETLNIRPSDRDHYHKCMEFLPRESAKHLEFHCCVNGDFETAKRESLNYHEFSKPTLLAPMVSQSRWALTPPGSGSFGSPTINSWPRLWMALVLQATGAPPQPRVCDRCKGTGHDRSRCPNITASTCDWWAKLE